MNGPAGIAQIGATGTLYIGNAAGLAGGISTSSVTVDITTGDTSFKGGLFDPSGNIHSCCVQANPSLTTIQRKMAKIALSSNYQKTVAASGSLETWYPWDHFKVP